MFNFDSQVYAQRRPGLHNLLDSEDELFFLISILLDRHSLRTTNASFAESIYGLKRASEGQTTLSKSQRQMSLIFLTLIPYLRSKLDNNYYTRHAQPTQSTRPRYLEIFGKVYPLVFAAHEGITFAYQLLYLLGTSPYYSPGLHMLGLSIVRISGSEVAEAEKLSAQKRAQGMDRIRRQGGPVVWQWFKRALRGSGEILSQHTRTALIVSVFLFKLLEWWYTSAEHRFGQGKPLPPPPPPPEPLPAVDGIQVLDDVKRCPLCSRIRINPALIATSGHVFCYRCAYKWVEARGCCPVTNIPASLEHIRRLYRSM